jgi:methionine-rich copper-binding protein CopC
MNTAIAKAIKIAAGCVVTLALGLSSAHAYVIDTKLGSRDLANSGDATELAAIEQASGNYSLTQLGKLDGNAIDLTRNPSTTNQFFIDVGPVQPLYFLLKFGTGNTGADNTYFFQNVADFTKLVFSNNQISFLFGNDCGIASNSCNTGRLSHVSFYGSTDGGGSGSSVPEPATIALIGLGVLGFAAARRKANRT